MFLAPPSCLRPSRQSVAASRFSLSPRLLACHWSRLLLNIATSARAHWWTTDAPPTSQEPRQVLAFSNLRPGTYRARHVVMLLEYVCENLTVLRSMALSTRLYHTESNHTRGAEASTLFVRRSRKRFHPRMPSRRVHRRRRRCRQRADAP
ncbi:hypothetical protein OH77DRAFT_269743 [Trametes cingulata]|nr:hypothetical protein OH77DRAFT_269743 [Trametes cingulata]